MLTGSFAAMFSHVKWLAAWQCLGLVLNVMWREACIAWPVRGAELTTANFAEMASKQPGIKHCLTDGIFSNTFSIVQNWQLIQLISEGVCMLPYFMRCLIFLRVHCPRPNKAKSRHPI